MNHRRAQNMSSIMQSQANVRSDVCDYAEAYRDCMHDHVAHIFLIVRSHQPLLAQHVQVVKLQQRHESGGGRRTVNRSVITVLVQEGNKSAVIQMSVTYDYSI